MSRTVDTKRLLYRQFTEQHGRGQKRKISTNKKIFVQNQTVFLWHWAKQNLFFSGISTVERKNKTIFFVFRFTPMCFYATYVRITTVLLLPNPSILKGLKSSVGRETESHVVSGQQDLAKKQSGRVGSPTGPEHIKGEHSI